MDCLLQLQGLLLLQETRTLKPLSHSNTKEKLQYYQFNFSMVKRRIIRIIMLNLCHNMSVTFTNFIEKWNKFINIILLYIMRLLLRKKMNSLWISICTYTVNVYYFDNNFIILMLSPNFMGLLWGLIHVKSKQYHQDMKHSAMKWFTQQLKQM